MLIKKIILTVLSLFPGYVFGMEKNKSNKNVSANDVSNHSENREKISPTASTNDPSTKKQIAYEIIKVEVKNQFDDDGGGKASCGYHALKNGFLTACWINASEKDQSSLYGQFKSAKLIKKLFGKEDSVWRSQIIALRKKKFATDFMRDQLLCNLMNAKKINDTTHIKGQPYALNCEKDVKVIFEALPENELYREVERDALYNILTDVATQLIKKCTSSPHVNSTYTVSFEDIKQVLITELKQKAALDANPAYQTVNSEEKIKAYFPKLNRISFSLKAEDTLIAHHETNKVYKRSYTPHSSNNNNQPNIEGEWLSSEELNFLVQFEESRKGKPSLPKLGSTPIFFLENQKENPLEYLITYDSDFNKFVQRLQDPTQTFVGIILPYWAEHWVACVINKHNESIQFIFLNSASDKEYAKDKDAIKLVEMLTKSPFTQASSQKPENKTSTSESKTSSHESNNATSNAQPASSADTATQEPKEPESKLFKKSDVTFDNYVGELPEKINQITHILNSNSKLYTEKFKTLPRMMLLYGPPGTGKKFLAKLIASNTHRPYAEILATNLLRKHPSEAIKELCSVFKEASRLQKPVIILIDKIDTILTPDILEGQHGDLKGALNCELDKITLSSFCIGTANQFANVDDATKKRCSYYCIKLSLPNITLREKVIQRYAEKLDIKNDRACKELARKAAGFSCHNLESTVELSLIIAQTTQAPEVTENHFLKALEQMKVDLADQLQSEQNLPEENNNQQRFMNYIEIADVKNQSDNDGGGAYSSGYHAIRNAFLLAQRFTEPERRMEFYTKLKSNFAIDNFTTEMRGTEITQLTEDLIYNSLLLHLGAPSNRDESAEEIIKWQLRRTQKVVDKALPTQAVCSIGNDHIRQILRRALPTISKRLTETCQSFINASRTLQAGASCTISPDQIINTFNSYYGQPNLSRMVRIFFPDLKSLNLETVITAIASNDNGSGSNQSKPQAFLRERSTNQTFAISRVGELKAELTYKEMNAILEREKQLRRQPGAREKVDPLVEFILLEDDRNFDKIKGLQNRLEDLKARVVSVILLPIDNHWVTCVVFKESDKLPYYFFADSLGKLKRIDESVMHLVSFLNEKVQVPNTVKEDASRSEDRTYSAGEQLELDHEAPPLSVIFNKSIPSIILSIINSLRDPTIMAGERINNLAMPLLLYGPPGTGKNSVVGEIAKQSGKKVIYKSGGSFTTEYKGSTEKSIEKLFEEATAEAQKTGDKVILFIDEIDGLVSKTGTDEAHDGQKAIALLKTILNKPLYKRNIFLIAATNNKDLLEKGVAQRFNTLVMGLPDYKARKKIFQYHFEQQTSPISITSASARSRIPKEELFFGQLQHLVHYFNERQVSPEVALARNISKPFFKLMVGVTEGFSARELGVIVTSAVTNFIQKLPYQIHGKHIPKTIEELNRLLANNDSAAFRKMNKMFEYSSETFDKAIRTITLDISPSAFFRYLHLMSVSLGSLLPLERYFYEALFFKMKELLSKDDIEYKKQAAKYVAIFNAALGFFGSLTGMAVSIGTKML